MKHPAPHTSEHGRAYPRSLTFLDSVPETSLDRLCKLVANTFQVPFCLIVLADETRIWLTSSFGLALHETPGDLSFCAHVVETGLPLVAENAGDDARFKASPFVTGAPLVGFYAGVPLLDDRQCALGALCVIDRSARAFSPDDVLQLQEFGKTVVDVMLLQQRSAELDATYGMFSEGPVAILVFNVQRTLTLHHASSNAAELLGLTPAKLAASGFSFEDILTLHDRHEFKVCLDSLCHGRFASRELNVRLAQPASPQRSLFVAMHAEYGNDGSAVRIHAYVLDTTRQKQLESSLEGANQRLKLALDAARLGTWDANFQTGQLLVDERAATILDLSPLEADANFDGWAPRVHPKDYAQMRTALDAHLNGSSDQYLSEYRLRRHDGQSIWVQSHGRVVERDRRGMAARMVGTHLDVTVQKHQENIRNRQQQLLALLSEAQQQFLVARNAKAALQKLLDPLMAITDSRFGMLAEVKQDENGETVLDVPALSQKGIEAPANRLFTSTGTDYCSALRLGNLEETVFGKVLRAGSTLVVNDAVTLDLAKLAPDVIPPLDSFMALPCLYNEKTLGIVALGNRDGGFDQDLVQLLQPLAQCLGLLLHARDVDLARQRAEEELKTLAAIDALTGIANRRVFLEHSANALAILRRYGTPFSLALIDIDHFKAINDQYGHPTGDQALKCVTQSIAGHLRSSDCFGRLGGEEFGILLPNTLAGDALALCERLRQVVAKTPVRHGHLSFQIHISIGVAPAHTRDISIEELMNLADQALYQAKTAGRNRVICSEPLSTEISPVVLNQAFSAAP
ncbi:MAG: hypothetical protein RJA63_3500 [Pseudomonadota bacterium]|jgi:diguanylate cyclase (GGDEF)-like protein